MAVYKDVITIFGGSSFIGRELISALIPQGWTVNLVSNNESKTKKEFERHGLLSPKINFINGYEKVSPEIVSSSFFVVNMMQGPIGFDSGNEDYKNAFKIFIELTSKAKESNILHLSCLGANSLIRNSPYLKEKGMQEDTIRLRVQNHTIVRTGVIFSKDDIFFNFYADYFKENSILYLPQETHNRYWQLTYLGDVVLAITKIINHPEVNSAKSYNLAADEKFKVFDIIKAVSYFTGFNHCSVISVPTRFLNILKKITLISAKKMPNPNHIGLLNENFITMGRDDSKSLLDLNIQPTLSKEVMPLYLFRN